MPRKNQYTAGPVTPGKRPAPPPGLDERETKIWSEVTRQLPADWFSTDSAPVLRELIRHIRHSDDLQSDITRARAALDQAKKEPGPTGKLLAEARKEWLTLLRAHGYQSERIGTLSTKLRLTPQSRYQALTARTKAAQAASPYSEPWNDWRNNDDESGSEPEFDEQNGQKLKQ